MAIPVRTRRPLLRTVFWLVAVAVTMIVPPGTSSAGENAGPQPVSVVTRTTLPAATAPAGGTFRSLTPARVLDTRIRLGATGPIPAGGTIPVRIFGRGGVPPQGVSAVAVNLTVAAPQRAGSLAAYPDGGRRPTTSNVNFRAGQIVANFAIIPVGADGQIRLANNSAGTVQVIGDISGYFLAGLPTAPGSFHSLSPARILDTRIRLGASGPIGAVGAIPVQIFGRGGIPSSGVSAVAINLTVTAPTASGNLTAYPDGHAKPATSTVNFLTGQTVANYAIVPVGTDGRIRISNNGSGGVQVVADISGYYLGGTSSVAGTLHSLSPVRFLDTRVSNAGIGPIFGTATLAVQITGRGGIPVRGVSAVAINITITAPQSAGNVTAYPDGRSRPSTSNVNFLPGQTIANFAVVPVGADGKIRLSNNSPGSVQLIGDVSGYFPGPPATPVPTASFSGRVASLDGTALPGTNLLFHQFGSFYRADNGADGTYALNVPDGTYYVTCDLSAILTSANWICGPEGGTAGQYFVTTPPKGQIVNFIACPIAYYPKCLRQ